ncbi:hypothetical protein NE865_08392 [Phthorimaea operculella]|nr:hypothetical protein NE865_08392 [Phthorimaea operculella]
MYLVLKALVLLINLIRLGHSLPAPYCLYAFNGTDCGAPPTPIFTYWKPGSRCEISYWRGCPTYNRFESKTSCSHFCISRLRSGDGPEPSPNEKGPCEGEINTNDCGVEPSIVYTYKKSLKTCLKAHWKGCTTSNKFADEIQCLASCTLSENDIDNIDNIIESFNVTSTPSTSHVTVKKHPEFKKLLFTKSVTVPVTNSPAITSAVTDPVTTTSVPDPVTITAVTEPVTTTAVTEPVTITAVTEPETTLSVIEPTTTAADTLEDMTPTVTQSAEEVESSEPEDTIIG